MSVGGRQIGGGPGGWGVGWGGGDSKNTGKEAKNPRNLLSCKWHD